MQVFNSSCKWISQALKRAWWVYSSESSQLITEIIVEPCKARQGLACNTRQQYQPPNEDVHVNNWP